MQKSCEECGYEGNRFNALDLFAAGRSYDGYSSGATDVPLWGPEYEADFRELVDQMVEAGEEWTPRQWFEAGKNWVSEDAEEPVVTPDYLLGAPAEPWEAPEFKYRPILAV